MFQKWYNIMEVTRVEINIFRNYYVVKITDLQDIKDNILILEYLKLVFTQPIIVKNIQKNVSNNDSNSPFSFDSSQKHQDHIKRAFKRSSKNIGKKKISPFSPKHFSSELSASHLDDMDFDDMDDDLFEIMQQEFEDPNAHISELPLTNSSEKSVSCNNHTDIDTDIDIDM